MSATVLHLIPVLSSGGGGRAAVAAATSPANGGMRHRIASLRPAHPVAAAAADAQGVEVLDAPEVPDVLEAISEADLVTLHYWNSPELTELLELEFPEMRLLLWSHIAGDEPPQVMPPEVVAGADLARATSPRAVGALAGVPVIPPVGEWERFEGVRRSDRPGFNVGYVGLVGYTKMHPRFAEVSASIRVPDARIIVCGAGDAVRNLRRRIAELGAQERFELLGQVEDVGAAMSDFDVFGYPLREETTWSSDLALKEAMQCGVPPVVLADGSSDLLVEDGVTGVVVDGIEDYAPAVEALHADPAERRRLGEGAREHARRAWSPAALAPLWTEAYERLMAAPKAPRPPLLEAAPDPPGAHRLVRGMGGGELEAAIEAPSGADGAAADRMIAEGRLVVGYTDGGLIDYRRRNPGEYQLALWTALFLRRQGRPALAAAEFARARELGCPAARLDAHMTEAVPG
jgi:glycosyltransferase involved in cell wall biosynthesis